MSSWGGRWSASDWARWDQCRDGTRRQKALERKAQREAEIQQRVAQISAQERVAPPPGIAGVATTGSSLSYAAVASSNSAPSQAVNPPLVQARTVHGSKGAAHDPAPEAQQRRKHTAERIKWCLA